MKKILIIEDNQDCITLYRDILGPSSSLEVLTSLKELNEFLRSSDLDFDLVISDLKLGDGFFLDWVEKTKSNLMERFPTIIVSSVEDLGVLETSFEWGATDYLIKPFRKGEIIAKIAKAQKDYIIKSQYLEDQEFLEELTSIEVKIFQRLMAHPDQYLTREKIVNNIWKKVAVNPKTFDVHLSNLRRKLVSSKWKIDNLHEGGWKLSRKNKE